MKSNSWVAALSGVLVGCILTMFVTFVTYASVDREVRASAMTASVADSTFLLVPFVKSLDEGKVEQFQRQARGSLLTGIYIMHHNLGFVDDSTKEVVVASLESIARDREKLLLGRFADEPDMRAEEILALYHPD